MANRLFWPSGRLSRRKPGEDSGASPPDERLEGLSATGQRAHRALDGRRATSALELI